MSCYILQLSQSIFMFVCCSVCLLFIVFIFFFIYFSIKINLHVSCYFFFFFQAEDGIRDRDVTGVQTCALPIWASTGRDSGTRWISAGSVAQERGKQQHPAVWTESRKCKRHFPAPGGLAVRPEIGRAHV